MRSSWVCWAIWRALSCTAKPMGTAIEEVAGGGGGVLVVEDADEFISERGKRMSMLRVEFGDVVYSFDIASEWIRVLGR
jgi:hypothetical protein